MMTLNGAIAPALAGALTLFSRSLSLTSTRSPRVKTNPTLPLMLIDDWKSRLPDLREIFRREEIDWLLTKCVKIGPTELIKFVIRTGYKDEPDLDEDGKPLLRRNTPVHYAAEQRIRDWISKVRELFKIYDKFNVNYTNESGLTHIHVACMCGYDDIVEKFLELGQDPNLPMKAIGDTLLKLALKNRHTKTFELLLRNGVDPNLVLHFISSNGVDDDMAEKFFKICDDIQQKVQVDARNKSGFTALHVALCNGKKKAAESLLRRGADPKLTKAYEGWISLHFIAFREIDDDLMKWFFEICNDMQLKVQVNAQDNYGNTPLHMALARGHKEMVKDLLRRGANPNLHAMYGWTALHIIGKFYNDIEFLDKFFQICDDMQQNVQIDARCNSGDTALHLALSHGKIKASEWLLRRGIDPNSSNLNGSTSLHIICKREADDGENFAEKFFQICKDMQQKVQVDAQDDSGRTPLHFASQNGNSKLVELLLRRGANAKLADEDASTPLHNICNREQDDNLAGKFFEICEEMQQKIQVDARNKLGNTSLHLALSKKHQKLVESLLRNGADPNWPCAVQRLRPLHIICRDYDDNEFLEKFFQICDDMQQKVQIDARCELGFTALHMALYNGRKKASEILLRRGADPNFTSAGEGIISLHLIASGKIDDDLMEWFFEICDNMQLKVQVNSSGKFGLTPLHLAILKSKKQNVKDLLRRGANPNSADTCGLLPLHIICNGQHDDDLVKLFFEITDDVQQTVQVDAQDKKGRTPLQTAVANISPGVVDVLLDRGADLSKFVFPIEELFRNSFDENECNWDKLKLASGTLVIVERLEKRGYDLSRSDALTIIDSFVKYELFEKSSDLSEKCWYDEEEFTSKAKEIIIIPNLSLYDLILLPSEKEDKLLTYTDYFEVERSNNLDNIPEQYRDKCLRHLCEKMSRGYVQSCCANRREHRVYMRRPAFRSCVEELVLSVCTHTHVIVSLRLRLWLGEWHRYTTQPYIIIDCAQSKHDLEKALSIRRRQQKKKKKKIEFDARNSSSTHKSAVAKMGKSSRRTSQEDDEDDSSREMDEEDDDSSSSSSSSSSSDESSDEGEQQQRENGIEEEKKSKCQTSAPSAREANVVGGTIRESDEDDEDDENDENTREVVVEVNGDARPQKIATNVAAEDDEAAVDRNAVKEDIVDILHCAVKIVTEIRRSETEKLEKIKEELQEESTTTTNDDKPPAVNGDLVVNGNEHAEDDADDNKTTTNTKKPASDDTDDDVASDDEGEYEVKNEADDAEPSFTKNQIMQEKIMEEFVNELNEESDNAQELKEIVGATNGGGDRSRNGSTEQLPEKKSNDSSLSTETPPPPFSKVEIVEEIKKRSSSEAIGTKEQRAKETESETESSEEQPPPPLPPPPHDLRSGDHLLNIPPPATPPPEDYAEDYSSAKFDDSSNTELSFPTPPPIDFEEQPPPLPPPDNNQHHHVGMPQVSAAAVADDNEDSGEEQLNFNLATPPPLPPWDDDIPPAPEQQQQARLENYHLPVLGHHHRQDWKVPSPGSKSLPSPPSPGGSETGCETEAESKSSEDEQQSSSVVKSKSSRPLCLSAAKKAAATALYVNEQQQQQQRSIDADAADDEGDDSVFEAASLVKDPEIIKDLPPRPGITVTHSNVRP
ncbi:unnamed protein product [Trichogramma brassicae]|uniref:Uncharacterized protein n=1 Tax=Trichogramma brassicae TaxID=86971 RepID=A0A6H5IBD3_9HYME|nr:unnamed protein product [Trichogramma brassicae]